uniref:Shisa N-terminal domain-containing protein n=1 Tax=Bubo bubo TaxID=30461 RepID=A0A8C0I9Z4_BUBBB
MRKRLYMLISLVTNYWILPFFSVLGEDCQAYIDRHGKAQPAKSCPNFCCGDCMLQYCCSDVFLKFGEERQFQCNLLDGRYERGTQRGADEGEFRPRRS